MAAPSAESGQGEGSGVSAQNGSPSLPDPLGLRKFGGAGEAVIYMHGPESSVDIAMLWKSEDDLKDDVLGIMEKESFTINDETIGFVQGLVDFWKAAKVQSMGMQADRADELRDDIRWGRGSGSSSSASSQVLLPPAFQKQSQKVKEIGKRMREGMREWEVSKGPRISSDTKDKVQEVLEIFIEAGPRSVKWKPGIIAADMENNRQVFLNDIIKYKSTLGGRVSAWKAWRRWVQRVRQPLELAEGVPCTDPFLPEAEVLGAYFLSKKDSGPTGPSGAWWHLEWWRVHVGLRLPTNDPSNEGFKRAQQGHQVDSGTTVDPWVMANLTALSCQGRGIVSELAAMTVIFLGGCVRFAHAQRSKLVEVTDTALVFFCGMGKVRKNGVRPPFHWPVPRVWFGVDVGGRLAPFWTELRKRLEVTEALEFPYLVPDIACKKGAPLDGGTNWYYDKSLSDAKFSGLLKSILLECQVPRGVALSITGKSLRKFEASAGDAFEFDAEFKNAMGNWQGVPGNTANSVKVKDQTAMPTTYSVLGLQNAYKAKKLVSAGTFIVMEKLAGPDLSRHLEKGLFVKAGVVTWEHVISAQLSSKGNYEKLNEAIKGQDTIKQVEGGALVIEEGFLARIRQASSISGKDTGADRFEKIRKQQERDGESSDGFSGADAVSGTTDGDSDVPTEEDDTVDTIKATLDVMKEVDAMDELSRMDWFTQSGSKPIKVHIVKENAKDGKYIPLCRKMPFPNTESGAGTGVFAINVTGKRALCVACGNNLSFDQRVCLGLA